MLFNRPTAAALSATALAVFASAQGIIPDSQVPNIGGGVWNASDPAIANYTFKFLPPFSTNYGGYYKWAANNNTVALKNVTAVVGPLGLTKLGSGDATNTKYAFFEVSEGTPKEISTTSPSSSCSKHDARWGSEGSGKGCGTGKFKKILHVIFENENYNWTMNDMWWKLLATRGKVLTNSHGVTHPSYSNYVSLVAGDYFGIENQDWYNINTTTIYDLLDAKGLDYATYAEWYTPVSTARGPNDCNNALYLGPLDNTNPRWNNPVYRRVDVPALLFSTYTSNYTRCSKIYNATAQFDSDVWSHKLPAYSFYVPDMLHNGHDPESNSDYDHQSSTAGIWFNAFLDMYLPALTAQGTLVVASWDEATWQDDNDAVPNNNNTIATLLFGYGITPNTRDNTYVTHYGTLRATITNFGLGSLGRNDTNATNGDLSLLVS
jgi:Phosphoesterase family